MSERLDLLNILQGDYSTPEQKLNWYDKAFATARFYKFAVKEVFGASKDGRSGELTSESYYRNAVGIFRGVERVGGKITVTGFEQVPADGWPYVFVANHMGVLETFLFGAIMHPKGEHNFVVKKSLTEYPVFKHIMHGLKPIVVGRENPREDLMAVFNQGVEKLNAGSSMIIFPQKTRALEFLPENFNTIGIKLARRANVKIVPVALKTDFWARGKILKDYGGVYPQRKVHFHFGAPIEIQGKGHNEHAQIVEFIGKHVKKWEEEE
jgi:1-acyl-sn-glycerol-3-phosphate acyltransferase